MKKLFLAFAAALLVSAGICNSASAQEWPQRTIRIVVSFGPGGGADIIGRILADSLQSKLGQPVIVENKPGAGGSTGQAHAGRKSGGEQILRDHDLDLLMIPCSAPRDAIAQQPNSRASLPLTRR
jgi:tripartite-type tricarboxylate transporter receptor subunit TctC